MADETSWRRIFSTERMQLEGGVVLEYTFDDTDDDPGAPLSVKHAKLQMFAGVYEIVVTRDETERDEALAWGRRAAVLVRQLAADLERLRFEEGEEEDA